MPTTSRDIGPGQGGKEGMRSGNPDTTVPDIDRAAPGRHPPLISLVVSCFKVASFLPAFLESLRRQTVSLKTVDLIFVNDGSPDDSRGIIRAWMQRHARQARLVDQENQGLCGARNAGMAVARGTWVSFPDPDDVLDPRYLQRVTTFITEAGDEVDLLSTHPLMLDDTSGRLIDDHPLNQKFRPGNQVVDLDRHPNYIHLQAASAFYRLGRVMEQGLLFDPAIVPNFEDGYFTALYLADRVAPRVGIVADAYYHYRLRADGSSAVQTSWQHPDKYVNLPRRGYLRLAEQVVARLGMQLRHRVRPVRRIPPAAAGLGPPPGQLGDRGQQLEHPLAVRQGDDEAGPFLRLRRQHHVRDAGGVQYAGDRTTVPGDDLGGVERAGRVDPDRGDHRSDRHAAGPRRPAELDAGASQRPDHEALDGGVAVPQGHERGEHGGRQLACQPSQRHGTSSSSLVGPSVL